MLALSPSLFSGFILTVTDFKNSHLFVFLHLMICFPTNGNFKIVNSIANTLSSDSSSRLGVRQAVSGRLGLSLLPSPACFRNVCPGVNSEGSISWAIQWGTWVESGYCGHLGEWTRKGQIFLYLSLSLFASLGFNYIKLISLQREAFIIYDLVNLQPFEQKGL